ncbi:hypothetical protein [Streptomyces sp. NPDC007172]|uniref:hypothetical protein n=2 Tax=unclassified Streptomyces TaxID=2593676 RepID=UPI0036C11869
MLKKLSTVAVLTAALAVTAVPSANAATAASACGSSYSLVGHYPLKPYIAQAPSVGGYLDIYYSSGTGKNCAVAYPTSAQQSRTTSISVSLRIANGTWEGDAGPYHSYAGPVYVSARGTCIDALGDIEAGYTYHGGFYGGHCG